MPYLISDHFAPLISLDLVVDFALPIYVPILPDLSFLSNLTLRLALDLYPILSQFIVLFSTVFVATLFFNFDHGLQGQHEVPL